MRTQAHASLPLFRSDGQARLLTHVFLDYSADVPIAEIARRLGLDPGGLTREATRLERAGILRSTRVGRQRHLRPNVDSPFYEPLRDLLARSYGPPRLIAAALAPVAGVEQAYIYGSWAARYVGQSGPPPHDIDILVVGEPSRRDVVRVALELSTELALEVAPHIVTAAAFEQEKTGFLRTVKQGPLIALDLRDAA